MKDRDRAPASAGFKFPDVGKISAGTFEKVILPNLGRRDPAVVVGPRHGVDVGVIEVAPGRVLVVTTDPVFVVPAYGWEKAAWFAVHILASDAATSGLPPRFMTVDLNLPMSMTEEDFTRMWTAYHRECDALGISIVSGHTARYHGTDYPMVGGATVMCLGPKEAYVTPAMARPGDAVIVTKGAAIEATALFAATFPDRIAAVFGTEFAERAGRIFQQMTVVDDALTAVSVGVRHQGVTGMHDATECGVLGGLFEVAAASGNGIRVEKEKIIVGPEAEAICRHWGMDPYAAISEGTLIITCVPDKAGEVLGKLAAKGIPASIVGEMTAPGSPLILTERGADRPLRHPEVDPFWQAFARESARNS